MKWKTKPKLIWDFRPLQSRRFHQIFRTKSSSCGKFVCTRGKPIRLVETVILVEKVKHKRKLINSSHLTVEQACSKSIIRLQEIVWNLFQVHVRVTERYLCFSNVFSGEAWTSFCVVKILLNIIIIIVVIIHFR